MKPPLLILPLLAVLLAGCDKAPPPPDPEWVKLAKGFDCLDQQTEACRKALEAFAKEANCINNGDTNGADFWGSNFVYFSNQEREAYRKLRQATSQTNSP